jgi:hypothetical protein
MGDKSCLPGGRVSAPLSVSRAASGATPLDVAIFRAAFARGAFFLPKKENTTVGARIKESGNQQKSAKETFSIDLTMVQFALFFSAGVGGRRHNQVDAGR